MLYSHIKVLHSTLKPSVFSELILIWNRVELLAPQINGRRDRERRN
jgi:hypothetical protein